MPTIPTHSILSLPAAFLRSLRRERDNRAAAHTLSHLDDHILRDIGLNRGDLDAAVRSLRHHR
jgi:uncharacterized protein YjiS (DUF1127 family)